MNELIIENCGDKTWSFNRPNNWEMSDVRYDRAIDETRKGNSVIAIQLYNEILSVFPNHLDSRHNLATLFDLEEDYEKAIELWLINVNIGRSCFPKEFDIEKHTLDWFYFNNRSFLESLKMVGVYSMKTEQKQTASDIFEEIMKLNPNDNQGVSMLLEELNSDI